MRQAATVIFRGFLTAWRFLTVIPLGRSRGGMEDFATSMVWFPLVGLVLGAFLAGFHGMARWVFPVSLSDFLTVFLLVVLTGALHLDGLADTVDALGGRSRQAALSIMKDTALGAFGATAIFFALGVKVVGLWALSETVKPWVLLLLPVMGRWAMVVLAYNSPYTRVEGGTGKAFVDHAAGWVLVLATVTALALATGILGWQGLAGSLGVLVGIGLFRAFLLRWLGGVTGDTLGAAGEGAEALALLIWVTVGK